MTTISSKSFDFGSDAFSGQPTSAAVVRLVESHIQPPKPVLRSGAITLDEFVTAEIARDASLEQRLQEAIRRLAPVLAPNNELSLRALRLAQGWTQLDLAQRLGTSQAMVSKWEAGHGDMQLSTVRALARTFGVTVATLDACIPADNEINTLAAVSV